MSRTSPEIPRMKTPTNPRDNFNGEIVGTSMTSLGEGEDELRIEVVD